jgi:hypothetical protein
MITFTVTPTNPSNNAILDFYFYCETKIEPIDGSAWSMFAIIVRDENGNLVSSLSWVGFGPFHPGDPPNYFWTNLIAPERPNEPVYAIKEIPVPNQSSYTFEVYLKGNGGKAYARNLNLIVEIMDGLPPS